MRRFSNAMGVKCILISEIIASDTMMLRKNNKWFMLTNICSAGIGDYCHCNRDYCDSSSELHIYHSDELLSMEWKPISDGNPVIFDSEKARNGGVFFHSGNIYRINQIHGKNHYGKAFGINLIKALNENSYAEMRIDIVEPYFKQNIKSSHHFHANSNFAVVDFNRDVSFMRTNCKILTDTFKAISLLLLGKN